jgi:FKBP-type peptidyl-prolyl cis-trans isomerase SlyD
MMAIENDKVVSLEYKLTEKGGSEVLDSNEGQAPLEFITGKSQIIPGLEKQLTELSKGEKAKLEVPAAEAYGEVNLDAVDDVPKEQFAGIDLEVGLPLFGQGENGETIQVVVKAINDDTVTIDYNHPLAGKDLVFDVNILDVRDATADELASGQVGGGHCDDGACGCG